MGPKKADNASKGRRPSQPGLPTTEEPGYTISFSFYSYLYLKFSHRSSAVRG
jgi:hypothetical protein